MCRTCWGSWRGCSIGCGGCWWRCILIKTRSTVMIGKMWIMRIMLLMRLEMMMTTLGNWWCWLWCLWRLCRTGTSRCWLMEEIHFITSGKTDTSAWRSWGATATRKEYISTGVGRTVYRAWGAGRCGILENGSTYNKRTYLQFRNGIHVL